MAEPIEDEAARTARLLDAQDKAAELFAQIEQRELIVPGVTERAASDAIRDLAADLFGMVSVLIAVVALVEAGRATSGQFSLERQTEELSAPVLAPGSPRSPGTPRP